MRGAAAPASARAREKELCAPKSELERDGPRSRAAAQPAPAVLLELPLRDVGLGLLQRPNARGRAREHGRDEIPEQQHNVLRKKSG